MRQHEKYNTHRYELTHTHAILYNLKRKNDLLLLNYNVKMHVHIILGFKRR